MQASYTWSKCLTNSLGYFGSYGDEEGAGESQTQATQNFFQNEYNPMGDYGRCTIDTPQNFNAYGVYNLPFGRGKLFGAATSTGQSMQSSAAGRLRSTSAFRSGFAITPFAGAYMGDENPLSAVVAHRFLCAAAELRSGCARAEAMQTVQIGEQHRQDQPQSRGGERGCRRSTAHVWNCQIGSLRGPSLKTADLNLTKQFPVTERSTWPSWPSS